MIIRVLDPTNEIKATGGQPAVRPTTLKGKTVGFISNGKEGTKGYFAELERQFREVFGVADVVWRTKSNFSAPADAAIVGRLSSPVSGIEAVAHRAVCTTLLRLNDKASPP
jgi:hypothetical protein